MEYEIESESVLFDPSTNPSLEPQRSRPLRDARAGQPGRQKAEAIPDEGQAA